MKDRGWPRGAPRPRRGAQAGRPRPLRFRPPPRAQGTSSHTAKNLPSPVLFHRCIQRITPAWQTCCLPLAERGETRKRGSYRRIHQALCRKSFLRCHLNPDWDKWASEPPGRSYKTCVLHPPCLPRLPAAPAMTLVMDASPFPGH